MLWLHMGGRLARWIEGRWWRWFDGGKNGKIYGKGMNAVWQRFQRLGRVVGERKHCAENYSITTTMSMKSAPFDPVLTFSFFTFTFYFF